MIQVQFYPAPQKLIGIQIISVSGQKVIDTKVTAGQGTDLYRYNLRRYPSGLYLVRAIFTDKVLVRRVIKD
jgi:hypothetical protein